MKNINKLKILIVFIILNLLSINSFIKAETSPIIDNSNDVNRFVDDVFVDKGDYHDEIDFYFLDFSADNVTVTFAETPSLDTVSYGYKITIIWTHVNEGENYTEIKTGYLTEGFGTSSVFTILQDSNGTIIDTCGTIDTVYLSDKQLITPINTTGIADPSNAYNVTATSNFITNENSQSVLYQDSLSPNEDITTTPSTETSTPSTGNGTGYLAITAISSIITAVIYSKKSKK